MEFGLDNFWIVVCLSILMLFVCISLKLKTRQGIELLIQSDNDSFINEWYKVLNYTINNQVCIWIVFSGQCYLAKELTQWLPLFHIFVCCFFLHMGRRLRIWQLLVVTREIKLTVAKEEGSSTALRTRRCRLTSSLEMSFLLWPNTCSVSVTWKVVTEWE